ncbi:MAG: response regulator [Deltaproteobacteria bacterium]|nr:response regulator [Deltaproteobacteria bacterium]
MTLKVLAVDDSKTIRKIVSKAFSAYDCEVLEAENGIDGLSIASREKPDLIVLDITMPVMNGVEMLGKLKGQPDLKDIPVIMLTAESGKDNVMQIVKMGVRDYMVKPFKGEQLIERVLKIYTLQPKEAAASSPLSSPYFSIAGDIQILSLPEKSERGTMAEIESDFNRTLKTMATAGLSKMILDARQLKEVNMLVIKLVLSVVESCQKSKIHLRMVGSPALGTELKGFQETSGFTISASIEEAKATF